MQTNRLEYAITSGQIQIVAGERRLPAFLAYPNSGGVHPGIVLLDDSRHIAALRQTANRLAQHGLYALAPTLDDSAADAAGATARAALQVLRTHNHCSGSLALMGLSAAGSALALETADRVAAIIGIQAPPLLAAADLRHDPPPLLLIYGGPATPELHRLQDGFSPTPGRMLLRYPRAGAAFFSQPQTDIDRRSVDYAWTHMLAFLERQMDWSRPARPAVI